VTSNLRARLVAHNNGDCAHTADWQPWDLDVVLSFGDQTRALALERYLKARRSTTG
jgi:predicted GIY-YIG superfamily endonuclease